MMGKYQSTTLAASKKVYLSSCNSYGKQLSLMGLPPSKRKKLEHNNMHLFKGITTTENNGFPILQPFTSDIDCIFIPFSKRLKFRPEQHGVHFFEDDYKFRYATWNNMEHTMYTLRNYKYVMCPDHSLYIEEDLYSFLNKQSIFRSRFFGACCQLRGFNVIPTASWGGADSFKYCFEGLPHNSVIALCGVGIDSCRMARKLWEYGVRELESVLSPKTIIIYGLKRKIPGLSTPAIFIPPYSLSLNKRIPHE